MPNVAEMSRMEAEVIVQGIYLRSLGRDPFKNPYDAGAYDYVIGMMYHDLTEASIEEVLTRSAEAFARAEAKVRSLYREVLGRDPGPREPGGPWVDEPARAYVEDFRKNVKTEDVIRAELRNSPEFLDRRHRPAAVAEVLDNVLFEPATGKKSFELGISLFYAMSPDVSRDHFLAVADELADAGVEMARFAQTFTWDNPVGKANVIPYRAGTTYRHNEGIDNGKSVDPVPDEAHFEELGFRLDQLVQRGIRAQYTIFWGGMQPLFTRDSAGRAGRPPGEGGNEVIWSRVEDYLEFISKYFAERPEHVLEIVNETDHGHHLAPLGFEGRVQFLKKCAEILRRHHPKVILTASDGGHQPRIDGRSSQPAEEGAPYFDYHGVTELDYWNVHFPRDTVSVEGIPRWCRGSWHLYPDRDASRRAHRGKGGYGRSDENIFLTTEAEFERWNYRGSTRDWRLYGTMLWVTTMAGVGVTLHTHKGFFCEPGLTRDPIFDVVRAMGETTRDFPWHGAQSFNASWTGSPVKAFDGPFKVFSIASGDRRHVLITALNPKEGSLTLDLPSRFLASVHEITGELRLQKEVGPDDPVLRLPAAIHPTALVVRLAAI
jgi:hypothetical protein